MKLGVPEQRIFFGYDAVDNDYFWTRAEQARRTPVAGATPELLVEALAARQTFPV